MPGHVPWEPGRITASEGIQRWLQAKVIQNGPEHLPVQSEVPLIQAMSGQEVRGRVFLCWNPVRRQDDDVPGDSLLPEKESLLRKNVTPSTSLMFDISSSSPVVNVEPNTIPRLSQGQHRFSGCPSLQQVDTWIIHQLTRGPSPLDKSLREQ